MKKKILEIFAWVIFVIIMTIFTVIFFKYIKPIIDPVEIEIQLEDATIVVEKENGETITYKVKEDDYFYVKLVE